MAVYTYNTNSRFKNPERLSISGNNLDSVYACRSCAQNASSERALFLEINCFDEEIQLSVVCALCCLVEAYYTQGSFIKIEMNEEILPYQFLLGIGFFDQWNPGREWFSKPKLSTSFGIIRFDSERINAFEMLFSSFFSQHEQTRDKDIVVARLVVAEALNNIGDHSIVRMGYATIQLYPRREELEFVVCDFGVGIPQALFTNADLKVTSHLEILKKSIERGVTSKKNPHNKGMGLNIISEYANEQGCVFELLSGGASIKIEEGIMSESDLAAYPFHGTLLKLRIKVNILGVSDDDETGGIDI